MKSKLFTVSFTILFVFSSCLILKAQKGFDIAVMAQPQYTIVNGNINLLIESFTGPDKYVTLTSMPTYSYAAGAFAGYHFSDSMGVNIGILYSQQGQHYNNVTGTISGTENPFSETYSISLNYLKIPVQFQFNFSSDKTVSFSCYAGIYLGYLMNYTIQSSNTINNVLFVDNGYVIGHGSFSQSVTVGGTTSTQQNTYSPEYIQNNTVTNSLNSKPFNSFDGGANAGAGVQIKISNKLSMPVLVNYDIGLYDIKNHSSQFTTTSANNNSNTLFWGNSSSPNSSIKLYNSTLGLSVGIKMNL